MARCETIEFQRICMASTEQIQALVFDTLDEVNPQLPPDMRLARKTDEVLFGRDGKLDSLALVTVIVAVEEKINNELNAAISLSDERAMSRQRSPFRTVESLVAYVQQLLNEQPAR